MSSLGWLDVSEIDFNALLLLEPLHVRYIAEREPDPKMGTGRLAFTVAPLARVVYAVEPVANLRRYLYEKRKRLEVENLYPLDGLKRKYWKTIHK